MKIGLILALFSGIGAVVMTAPNAVSQTSGYGGSLLSVSASARNRWVEQAEPVQAALDHFDNALAIHNVVQLEAAGAKRSSAKLWQKFFRENPDATVTDRCPVSELIISEDTASWDCTETVTVISEGKPCSFAHAIRFMFARNNETWMVAGRQ